MKKFFFICVLIASQAQASYIDNRGLFPVGESEALMANSGVALSGSSGAAIYNPAGLAGLKQRKLSLTGNTYMLFNVEQKPFIKYDDRDLDLSVSGLQAIPSSVISTGVWNAWTGAFVVVVPEMIRANQVANYETANANAVLSQMVDVQFMLIGFSAGASLEKLDVGAGCYIGNYTSHQNFTLIGTPKNTAQIPAVSSGYEAIDVKLLLCQAGAQGNMSANNRWGVVARFPSIHLEGKGERSTFAQESPSGNNAASGVVRKGARYDIPLDISAGVENHSIKNLTLLLDVSMQLAQSFESFEGSGEYSETNSTLRANAGFRYALSDTKSLLGGIGYNPSSVELKAATDLHEDYLAYTFGFESREGSANMGVAFFAANSSGEARLADGRNSSIHTRATAIVLTTGFVF